LNNKRNINKSYKLSKIAESTIGGGVCHDVRFSDPHPIYIESSKGAHIWDVDGNKYIDYGMGNGSLLIGHSHIGVINAIKTALEKGYHFGEEHPMAITWGKKIIELVTSVDKVRFVGSGTEAIMLACRIARAYTNKNKIIRIQGHFHGWSDVVGKGFLDPFDEAVSLGIPEGTINEIIVIKQDINYIKELIENRDDIAAVILEPSGASWGTVPLEYEFNKELRELTKSFGILLIYDEIITGFRYSSGGYQELAGINPDMTTFGKIATGGTPGGVIGGKNELFQFFDYSGDKNKDRYNRIHHFGTFNANPITAAAGLATLEIIQTGIPQKESNLLAEILRTKGNEIINDLGLNCLLYGDSSLFHFFLQDPSQENVDRSKLLTKPNTKILKGIPKPVVSDFQVRLRQKGINLFSYTGGVLSSAHTIEDINDSLTIFKEVLSDMKNNGLII